MWLNELQLPCGLRDVSVLSGHPLEGVKERGAGVFLSRASVLKCGQACGWEDLPGFLIWLWLPSAMCLGSQQFLYAGWRSDLQLSAKS